MNYCRIGDLGEVRDNQSLAIPLVFQQTKPMPPSVKESPAPVGFERAARHGTDGRSRRSGIG